MSNDAKYDDNQPRPLAFSEACLSFILRMLPIKHGKHKLLDYVAPRIWNESVKPIALSMYGHKVVIDPNDLVGWHFVMIRSFDPEVSEILEKVCDSNHSEVLWDIGANKGSCFCKMATALPLLNIVAIEPQSLLSKHNINNLEAICPGRYEYLQLGIGEEEAMLTLVIPKDNMGGASVQRQQIAPDDKCEIIKIQTAQQIAESSKFGWPTVAKVDVEGYEPQIFRSLAPCFASRTCKAVVFENHKSEIIAFETIKALTEPHGYQIFGITKSLWSTALVPTQKHLSSVLNYVVIRKDVLEKNKQLSNLIISINL